MHPRNPERNIWFSNLILVVWLFSHRCGEFAQYALKKSAWFGVFFFFFQISCFVVIAPQSRHVLPELHCSLYENHFKRHNLEKKLL